MKKIIRILLVLGLLFAAAVIWLRYSTSDIAFAVAYDCPALGQKSISFPGKVTVSGTGKITGEVDVSWITANFQGIMRTRMPPEGGGGGNRYEYSSWAIKVNDSHQVEAFVHIKVRNYKYTKLPFGQKISIHAGTAEVDVKPIIKAIFNPGNKLPDFDTSTVVWNKTRDGGLADFADAILPSNWFDLNGILASAANDNLTANSKALLIRSKDAASTDLTADLERYIKDGTITPVGSPRFESSGSNGIKMVFEYTVSPTLAPVVIAALKSGAGR